MENLNKKITYLEPMNEVLEPKVTFIDSTVTTIKRKVRVAGYARVSSNSDDQLNSFTAQVSYYKSYIPLHDNWELVDIYADEGLSARSTQKRDDFNRMIKDAQKGKIDKIITKSISRFGRNTIETLSNIRLLKDLGISVYFESENIDTLNIVSEQILTIHSYIAEQELLRLSDSLQKNNRRNMRDGKYVSVNAPYGYRLVDKQLQIKEDEAEIVKRIFSEYVRGVGSTKIAKGLNDDNVPTKCGADRWKRSVITTLIKNERYIGDMLLQKSYKKVDLTNKKHKNNGELNQYYVEDTHEAIINPIVFKLANLILTDRNVNRVHKAPKDSVLTSKILCTCCNNTYKPKVNNKIDYWVCRSYNEDKELCSIGKAIPETKIFNAFILMYNKLKQNYKHILIPMQTTLEKIEVKEKSNDTELTSINTKLAELYRQREMLNNLVLSGVLDKEVFIPQNDDINKQISELKKEKSVLYDQDDELTLLQKTKILIKSLEESPDKITDFDENVFGNIVKQITIVDDTITFVLINELKLN